MNSPLATFAQAVYNAYLAELQARGGRKSWRKNLLRKVRRRLLKLADPEVIAQLNGFAFKTPFSSNLLLWHYEFPFYDAVLPRLAKHVTASRGPLIMVDVGANVGLMTYLVSRVTSGIFFCIEANPRFQTSLQHNLEQIPGSRARFVALTDEPRRAVVRHQYAYGNSNIEEVPEGGTVLDFMTLDAALLAEPDCAAANLLKIDTEGFELRILRGAQRILTQHHPVLFFEFFPAFIRREDGQPDELFALLRDCGYDRLAFYDGQGHLLTEVGIGETQMLKSLRRYCDMRQSFFDVAAFHAADTAMARDFHAAEAAFFEQAIPRLRRPGHE
jgi:FkbM family methyltransferase